MKVTCYYNKVLGMTPEELSSEVAGFCMMVADHYGVDFPYKDNIIIVKGLEDKEFTHMKDSLEKDNVDVFTGNVKVVFGYVEWM